MNLMGQFGDFQNQCGPTQMVLQPYCCCTLWVTIIGYHGYQTWQHNVHYEEWWVLRFSTVGKGLYMYTGNDTNDISAWVLINTVNCQGSQARIH
jgi:hypothetical protein